MRFFRDISMATLRMSYRYVPLPMKEALEAALLFDLPDRRPQRIETSAAENILLLTSELGTAVLGCGGTMARHVKSGASVTPVIVRSRERKECQTPYDPFRKFSPCECQPLDAAFKTLGAVPLMTSYNDFRSTTDRAASDSLVHFLVSNRPAVIYHPSLFSTAIDDRLTNRILWRAVQAIQNAARDWRPILRGYEFSQPLLANRYSDISRTAALKREAIGSIVPSLLKAEAAEAIVALNTYRSQAMQGGIGMAEGFQDLTIAAFNQISAIIEQRHECAVHS